MQVVGIDILEHLLIDVPDPALVRTVLDGENAAGAALPPVVVVVGAKEASRGEGGCEQRIRIRETVFGFPFRVEVGKLLLDADGECVEQPGGMVFVKTRSVVMCWVMVRGPWCCFLMKSK